MSQTTLIEKLKIVLADTYALYLKTQNYHWNVVGLPFFYLHEMFEEQYKDLADAIDDIAERVRILGEKVPASFSLFDKFKTIPDGDETANCQDMVQHLFEDQGRILSTLSQAASVAEDLGDTVTADLMNDRVEIHQKNAWMLESTLQV